MNLAVLAKRQIDLALVDVDVCFLAETSLPSKHAVEVIVTLLSCSSQ